MMIFKKEKKKRSMDVSNPSSLKNKQAGDLDNAMTEKNMKKLRATRASQAYKQKMKKSRSRHAHGHGKDGMDALSPRQQAVIQYVHTLCSSTATNESIVFTHGTIDVYANEMMDVLINSDTDSMKYVSCNIIDAYASHLALSIKDSRHFCRVWEGYMMSRKETVDKNLGPANNHLYDDFAKRFFQHELV
ncbi:unnamed protein product, partial [Urochloa humidicola]